MSEMGPMTPAVGMPDAEVSEVRRARDAELANAGWASS